MASTSLTQMTKRPPYVAATAAESLDVLTQSVARTIHYAHCLKLGQGTVFHELSEDRKQYLVRLSQAAIGMADTDAATDAQSLIALNAYKSVETILGDVHHDWEDHTDGDWLRQRFDQVEARLRAALSGGLEGGFRAVLARLGVKGVR